MTRTRTVATAAIVLVLLAAAAVWLLRPDPPATAAAPPATASPSPTATSTDPCSRAAARPFDPTELTVAGASFPVVARPRDARDVPGLPPLTQAGKTEVAWDEPPGIRPGSPAGNVLLNAHTWPDGSALGNRLLRELGDGDRIVLSNGDATQCYQVTRRIQVPWDTQDDHGFYERDGDPQVAIVVCSGRRDGPGRWTHRTLWFAKAVGT